jgi:Zn-dependent protease
MATLRRIAISSSVGAARVHFNPDILLVFPVFVLSIVVHECAHGLMALWNGDTTARDRGRLTLNPLPHVDPVGSILLPGILMATGSPFLFGWAKPIPVDWSKLRHPRNDQLKVALAGPASNALLALAFAALTAIAPKEGFFAPLAIMGTAGVVWNCALGLFNLIPIPPLDGSWLLMRFLPLKHIIALQHFRFLGFLLLMVLMNSAPISNVLFLTPLRAAVRGCLGLFGVTGVGL